MRYLLVFAIALLSLLSLGNAEARVVIGGGVIIGAPYYAYPPYYAYYPPYPYYPAPGYPPPGYPPSYGYSPYPVPPPAAQDRYYESDNGEYCREYRHTAVIEGQRQQVFGHACRQPDGSWRMVD